MRLRLSVIAIRLLRNMSRSPMRVFGCHPTEINGRASRWSGTMNGAATAPAAFFPDVARSGGAGC
jgi:hypothetical protein